MNFAVVTQVIPTPKFFIRKPIIKRFLSMTKLPSRIPEQEMVREHIRTNLLRYALRIPATIDPSTMETKERAIRRAKYSS